MTSLSNRTKRAQVLVLLFVVFIFYCIYNISNNFPTTNISNATSSSTIKDEKAQAYTPPPKSNVCKTDKVLRNVDPNHTKAHIEFWKHLTDNTVQVYKRRWQKFVSSIKRLEMPSWEGRGIVLVAGNRDTFQRTLTAIKVLRNMHRCELDIEVWHLSDEQPSIEMQQELEALGAVPKDLSDPQLPRPIIHRREAEKQ